jgi:hypothetical protein
MFTARYGLIAYIKQIYNRGGVYSAVRTDCLHKAHYVSSVQSYVICIKLLTYV